MQEYHTWGDCFWGSYQYDSSANVFRNLQKGETVCVFDFERKNDIKEANKNFRRSLKEYHNEDPEDIPEFEGDLTGPEMFELLKGSGWDLWGAAPFIAECWFKDLKIGYNVPTVYETGDPEFPWCEDSAFDTGANCWILFREGIVQSEEPFEGFDT